MSAVLIDVAEVNAQAQVGVHDVEAGVDGDHEGIGKVEVVEESKAEVVARIEANLQTETLLEAEVFVGGLGGDGFFGEAEHSAFDGEVGLEGLVAAPHHAEADGRDSDAGDDLAVEALGIAPDVGFGGFVEEDERQELGDVVHASSDEVAPDMAVVLDAGGVELAVGSAGEDAVVAVGGHSFDDDLALGLLRGLRGGAHDGVGTLCMGKRRRHDAERREGKEKKQRRPRTLGQCELLCETKKSAGRSPGLVKLRQPEYGSATGVRQRKNQLT
jgi:hypothetical protein